MLSVSILMNRAEPRGSSPALHPSPGRTDLDLKLELRGHIVAAPELVDMVACQEDAPRNVSRGDVPRDVPRSRTAGRAEGTRYGTCWGQAFRSRHRVNIQRNPRNK
eukprot:3988254-Pyramimonas_sp.AAC.1